MNPLLSILIPNYNYARYLRTCIESALALDYSQKEIIVIDDGSTDESRDILREYAAQGVIQAIYKKNGGQPSALNAGFERATGEVVYVLDSDDVVAPQMMTRVMSVWKPGVTKVQFCLESIDDAGNPIGSVFPNYPATVTPALLKRAVIETGEYQSPPTSANVYARSYLARLFPLDPKRFRYSDGPMNAVAPLYGNVETLPEPLCQYRMHGNNQWGREKFEPAVYTRAVTHNLELDNFVVEHARAIGLEIRPGLSDRAPWAMQYRMVSVCLQRKSHPLPESPFQVMWRGLRAVRTSETLSPAQKAAIIPWFMLMGVAPKRVAEELTKLRFHPTHRPAVLTKTLKAMGTLKRR